MIYLSYILDENTPSYGNRNKFEITKQSSISNGDVANDSHISTTVHIGTHIDMPYHFYKDGQTIENYEASFWVFKNPLIVEIKPKNLVIKDELIEVLNQKIQIKNTNYDILIVKTGICDLRASKIFWENNYGFDPEIYNYINEYFPSIRVLGFDSISVSSFQNRTLGREAHKRFLNPERPVLLLEDMDLQNVGEQTNIKEIIISPLRISNCDGLPCTVFGITGD